MPGVATETINARSANAFRQPLCGRHRPPLRTNPAVRNGHIGDGNLHFSFMGPEGMDQQTLTQYTAAITRAVYDLITSMGGSISAEHGIGMDKLDELGHYRSKTELDIMRTIKRALDPQNIMNPGKVLRL
jgi:FAD/FMN-containing dehydrogenase